MNVFLSLIIGYTLGCLNPTALLAKIKRVDVRQHGTGNLGATNAMLNFGKTAGFLVMLFDISKAYLAFHISSRLFPDDIYSAMIAGSAAVAGHIFPFYLGFRGGKGFAPFSGLVLAFSPDMFVFLLGLGIALMLITDISLTLQFSSLLLFPVLSAMRTNSFLIFLICGAVSVLILFRHRSNISSAIKGQHPGVRHFIREHFSK